MMAYAAHYRSKKESISGVRGGIQRESGEVSERGITAGESPVQAPVNPTRTTGRLEAPI
jgi:hypothetical protein